MMAIARQADLPLRARRRLPLTRAHCEDGPRPCPHATCRHHLGALPSGETCTLDMADRGGMSLEEIGEVLGLDSRESVRIIEEKAIQKWRLAAARGELPEILDHVDPDWNPFRGYRAAGPSVTVPPPPDSEPDAEPEIVEEEDTDPLASHIWAAYLRSSNERKYAAVQGKLEESHQSEHPHRDQVGPEAVAGDRDRVLEGGQEPKEEVDART